MDVGTKVKVNLPGTSWHGMTGEVTNGKVTPFMREKYGEGVYVRASNDWADRYFAFSELEEVKS